jgi:hypothetical protein
LFGWEGVMLAVRVRYSSTQMHEVSTAEQKMHEVSCLPPVALQFQ